MGNLQRHTCWVSLTIFAAFAMIYATTLFTTKEGNRFRRSPSDFDSFPDMIKDAEVFSKFIRENYNKTYLLGDDEDTKDVMMSDNSTSSYNVRLTSILGIGGNDNDSLISEFMQEINYCSNASSLEIVLSCLESLANETNATFTEIEGKKYHFTFNTSISDGGEAGSSATIEIDEIQNENKGSKGHRHNTSPYRNPSLSIFNSNFNDLYNKVSHPPYGDSGQSNYNSNYNTQPKSDNKSSGKSGGFWNSMKRFFGGSGSRSSSRGRVRSGGGRRG